MDYDSVPNEIWNEIFELVPPRQLAASVQRACRRFQALATRCLLCRILWLTPAQTEEELILWRTYKADKVSLPRSVLVAPLAKSDPNRQMWNGTPIPIMGTNMPAYNSIHSQLSLFTSLSTLTIYNIAFSQQTYRVLELIPTLRVLKVLNSQFDIRNVDLPVVEVTALPITHFQLHNVRVLHDFPSVYYPLRLLSCPSLTSLAITWDPVVSDGYRIYIHDPLSRNRRFMDTNNTRVRLATKTFPRASANLTNVAICIPILQALYFEGLASLTSPPPSASVPALRVKIHVLKSILKEDELGQLAIAQANQFNKSIDSYDIVDLDDGSSRYPRAVRGVWSYTGPCDTLRAFVPENQHSLYSTHAGAFSVPLTHLRFTPPAVPASHIVHCLERLTRPLELEHLEVCVHSWDTEIFFAIRKLCPNLTRVVVRYGEGKIDEGVLIMLGSSILSDMKRLHTLRLVYDPACSKDVKPARAPPLGRRLFYEDEIGLEPGSSTSIPTITAPPTANVAPVDETADIPLFDYLLAWDRYCPTVRRVQVGGSAKGIAWRRRWSGDAWREVWVKDAEDREDEGSSDDEGFGETWSNVENGSTSP